MTTVQGLIDAHEVYGMSVRDAVAAAYWAGQEQARGRIARKLYERADGYQHGRYWRVEAQVIDALVHAAGAPRDDAAEILAWDYDA